MSPRLYCIIFENKQANRATVAAERKVTDTEKTLIREAHGGPGHTD